jgi:hypothetical protein
VAALVLGAQLAAAPVFGLDLDEQKGSYAFRNFADADHVHVQSHFLDYDMDLRNGTHVNFHWNH